MNILDAIGLILLFGAIIFGGGIYFMSKKTKYVKNELPVPVLTKERDFETAAVLFPDISFPSEVEYEHIPELPWRYSDNKITIMARDPEWIYAYWDISGESRTSLEHTYGRRWEFSLPVLRVYDVTGVSYFNGYNANNYYDTVINDYAGSWYLHVGVPHRTYCVDLGRILNDGTYVMMVRSNFTVTPRNTISDRIDPEWMLVSEKERRLYSRIKGEGLSSAELFKQH